MCEIAQVDKNPPRAARDYALVSAVQFDVFIAGQDGKYTYWYISLLSRSRFTA